MATSQETKPAQNTTRDENACVSLITAFASRQEVPLFDAQVRNAGYKMLESIYQ